MQLSGEEEATVVAALPIAGPEQTPSLDKVPTTRVHVHADSDAAAQQITAYLGIQPAATSPFQPNCGRMQPQLERHQPSPGSTQPTTEDSTTEPAVMGGSSVQGSVDEAEVAMLAALAEELARQQQLLQQELMLYQQRRLEDLGPEPSSMCGPTQRDGPEHQEQQQQQQRGQEELVHMEGQHHQAH